MDSLVRSSKSSHYCPTCTTCLEPETVVCAQCAAGRPAEGWPDIETSPYLYLGKIIDARYLVSRFLGAGTSGQVYRGEALRFQRAFALKIVDSRRFSGREVQQEMLRRFEREVDVMSRLRNPHIVNLYETLQLSGQLFILVMDFVAGVTLQEMLDRVGRIKYRHALEIVRQVANGLHEAHCQGIVHRDLKPENVMIEQLPASGFFARVLDFGIAHMAEGVRDTQGFRGTPLYASPEQCLEAANIDYRSDIYSLGCVFFHCLTGRPPFDYNVAVKVMDAHIEAPPPSVFDAVPGLQVPEQVDALIRRMMAKRPEDRPQNLNRLVRKIDVLLRGRELHLDEATLPEPPAPHLAVQVASPAAGHSTLVDPPTLDDCPTTSSVALHLELVRSTPLPLAMADQLGQVRLVRLGSRATVCAIADDRFCVHVLSLHGDGYAETLTGARAPLTALEVDVANGRLFAADLTGNLMVWSMGMASMPRTVGRFEATVRAIEALSANLVAVALDSGEVVVLDLRTARKRVVLEAAGDAASGAGTATIRVPRALAYQGARRQLLVGFDDGHLALVHVDSGVCTVLPGADAPIVACSLATAGDRGAVLAGGQTLGIYRHDDDRPTLTFSALGTSRLQTVSHVHDDSLVGLEVDARGLSLWMISLD